MTVDTFQLKDVIRSADPLLIDAMPLLRTSETDFTGRWTVNEPRKNIPGSVWLPNIGHGVLSEEMTVYFQRQLKLLTKGDVDRPLVFHAQIGRLH